MELEFQRPHPNNKSFILPVPKSKGIGIKLTNKFKVTL
jgi:hypothetical protein